VRAAFCIYEVYSQYLIGTYNLQKHTKPAKTHNMTKMADSEEVLFSFRLPKDLKEAFQRTCEARDRNMSQELRAMIRGYNERYAGKRRETRDMEVQDMKVQDMEMQDTEIQDMIDDADV
jgi:hypothetical protein